MAATDEISAADDKTIVFRLKKPFALLPDALGKTGSNICVIMPERLAKTDPFTQVTEMVGSGPYRFKASERVPGSRRLRAQRRLRAAQLGHAELHGRPQGREFRPRGMARDSRCRDGAGALRSGEVDWWENPTADLLPMLRKPKSRRFTPREFGQEILPRGGRRLGPRSSHNNMA